MFLRIQFYSEVRTIEGKSCRTVIKLADFDVANMLTIERSWLAIEHNNRKQKQLPKKDIRNTTALHHVMHVLSASVCHLQQNAMRQDLHAMLAVLTKVTQERTKNI